MGVNIKAHEWGLAITDTQMQPKYTDFDYAPTLYMKKAETYSYLFLWSMPGMGCENSEHSDIAG